jgi:hypothetical protein
VLIVEDMEGIYRLWVVHTLLMMNGHRNLKIDKLIFEDVYIHCLSLSVNIIYIFVYKSFKIICKVYRIVLHISFT